MDIEKKRELIKRKKEEVPSHILEVGLNLLYIEPHDVISRIKEKTIIEQISLKDIFNATNKTVFIDISEHPYDDALDNIGYSKQLDPELAVIAKDIVLEEYQIFLNRIYQIDAVAFPISPLNKKAVEKFVNVMESMGVLPIPIIDEENDLAKIPLRITKVVIVKGDFAVAGNIIRLIIDERGNLLRC